jgi:hypothetical protein
VLLILAMLVLRALVPAGYMLAADDGHLALVLCGAGVPGAHHHDAHHPGPHTHGDPTCPYAQSAGPAPLPHAPVLTAAAIAAVVRLPVEFSQTSLQPGPLRALPARAPPASA